MFLIICHLHIVPSYKFPLPLYVEGSLWLILPYFYSDRPKSDMDLESLLKFLKYSKILCSIEFYLISQASRPTHFSSYVTPFLNPFPRGRDLPSPQGLKIGVSHMRNLKIFKITFPKVDFASWNWQEFLCGCLDVSIGYGLL